MIIGDWWFDSFAFGVGKLAEDKIVQTEAGQIMFNRGAHWVRIAPDQAASPLAGLVFIFTEPDWEIFRGKVNSSTLVLPDGTSPSAIFGVNELPSNGGG